MPTVFSRFADHNRDRVYSLTPIDNNSLGNLSQTRNMTAKILVQGGDAVIEQFRAL
jgi:hypothetical protein